EDGKARSCAIAVWFQEKRRVERKRDDIDLQPRPGDQRDQSGIVDPQGPIGHDHVDHQEEGRGK
ncbi:MAG TPA: hypothetical protein VH593_03890, partial [Ktedonobacteraceae bacterium]